MHFRQLQSFGRSGFLGGCAIPCVTGWILVDCAMDFDKFRYNVENDCIDKGTDYMHALFTEESRRKWRRADARTTNSDRADVIRA